MDRHPHFASSAPVSRAPSVHGEPNSQSQSPRHSTDIGSHFPHFWKAARHKTYGREIPHPDSPSMPLSLVPGGSSHVFPSGKPRPLVMGLGRPMPTPEEKQAYINSRSAWVHSQRYFPKTNFSPIPKQITLPGRSPSTIIDSLDTPSSPYVVVTPDILAQIAPEWIREQANAHKDLKEKAATDEKDEDADKITPLHTVPPAPIQVINPKEDATAVSEIVEDEVEAIDFPNPWARIRYNMREPFAEFMGTMFLIIFGNGVNNQVFLTANTGVSSSQQGSYLSVSWGWGLGVCMGVYVAGGISGGHINPAVTLSLAIFRGFPWRKVPVYWAAQLLGAFAGACIIFGLYQNAIDVYEGGANIRTIQGEHGTAQLFSTYPQLYLSNVSAFFQEFTDTAVLLIVILALGDRNNTPPPDGLNPVILLFLILGIGACLGTQTAYAVNPARDLGPRLMTYCMGYGREVWNYRVRDYTTPIIATSVGGIFGSFLYDALIYTGTDSPLNRRWTTKGPFSRYFRTRKESATTIKAATSNV